MPKMHFGEEIPSTREISAQVLRRLHRFSGVDIARTFYHLDQQAWPLSERTASLLRGLVAFEGVRITARLRPCMVDLVGRIWEIEDEGRETYVGMITERLGPWLGEADWTSLGYANTAERPGIFFESMLVCDFYPRVGVEE